MNTFAPIISVTVSYGIIFPISYFPLTKVFLLITPISRAAGQGRATSTRIRFSSGPVIIR